MEDGVQANPSARAPGEPNILRILVIYATIFVYW